MLPVTTPAAGATVIPILVATTRRATPDDLGTLFSGERSRRVSFAQIDVSIPPSHVPGEVEWPSSSPGDPSRHFVTRAVAPLDAGGFRDALRRQVRKDRGHRHVMVFVHGYNNLFDDAVYRLAQITADSGAPVTPVLFTWPSRGKVLAYGYDRESATYSRDALEKLLDELAAEPSVGEISVLAHSMGNWVTLEALRQQAIRRGSVPAKIRNVMLAAPDVDVDVARAGAMRMGKPRPRFTLFVSKDDRALAASRRVWGGVRLGQIDPTLEPYKSALAEYDIDPVDLTAVRGSDMLNHSKFADSAVVRAIGNRLSSGQDIGTRGESLGDTIAATVSGVASGVGSVAGAVVAAPIAIVDPHTRRNYGERLGAIVPGAEDPAPALASDDPPPAPRQAHAR